MNVEVASCGWNNPLAHAVFEDTMRLISKEEALKNLRHDTISFVREKKGQSYNNPLRVTRDSIIMENNGQTLDQMMKNVLNGPNSHLVSNEIKDIARDYDGPTLSKATELVLAGEKIVVFPEYYKMQTGEVVIRYFSIWTQDEQDTKLYHGSRLDLGKNFSVEEVRKNSVDVLQKNRANVLHNATPQNDLYVITVDKKEETHFQETLRNSIQNSYSEHRSADHLQLATDTVRTDSFRVPVHPDFVPSKLEAVPRKYNTPVLQERMYVKSYYPLEPAARYASEVVSQDQKKVELSVQPEKKHGANTDRISVEGKSVNVKKTALRTLLFPEKTERVSTAAPAMPEKVVQEQKGIIKVAQQKKDGSANVVKRNIRMSVSIVPKLEKAMHVGKRGIEVTKLLCKAKEQKQEKKSRNKALIKSLRLEKIAPNTSVKKLEPSNFVRLRSKKSVKLGLEKLSLMVKKEIRGGRKIEKSIPVRPLEHIEKMFTREQTQYKLITLWQRLVRKNQIFSKREKFGREKQKLFPKIKQKEQKTMTFVEQNQAQIHEKSSIVRFSAAIVLWLLVTEKSAQQDRISVLNKQNKKLTSEHEVRHMSWILFSIIYYLAMIREQAQIQPYKQMQKKKKKKKTKTQRLLYLPMSGVIFAR